MAEYYTVLKRAIAGVDPNQPDARRAVYDKARNALIGQLKAVDPPLTTAEISRQRLELEEAIRRVERESAAGLITTSRPAPPPAQPEPQRRSQPAAPPSEPAVREMSPPPPQPAAPVARAPQPGGGSAPPSPQDVFRRAIQEAGLRASPAPQADAQPKPRRAAPVDDAARYAATAPDLGHAEIPAQPRRQVRAPAPPPVEDYPPQPEHPVDEYEPEPSLAPEYEEVWDQDEQEDATESVAEAPAAVANPGLQVDSRDRLAFAAKGREGRGSRRRGKDFVEEESGEDPFDEPKPRRSRVPGIILSILVLALIGGLAAAAYSQRDSLDEIIAIFDSDDTPTPVAPPVETADESGKNTDRLLAGDPEPPPPPPTAEAPEAAEPDRVLRVVGAQEAPPPESLPLEAPSPPAEPEVPDAMAPEPLPLQEPEAAPVEVAAPPVSTGPSKAVLLEQGADSANVTSMAANVDWQFIEGGPNGPQVQALLDVPDRTMKVRMTLHRNRDDSLPASHLIEVTVDSQADRAVNEVPGVVLKPTEESNGQPLVGATVKVADGFFWVALSADPQDVQANMTLLNQQQWIDIPLVYSNGQRAILSFEKGQSGQEAIDRAIAAWGT